MEWQKLGLIFCPGGTSDWMKSHAAVPFANRLSDDIFRIYFCSRDERNRAQVGYLEIDVTRPEHLLRLSDKPAVRLGPLGAYDDNGVISSWFIDVNERKFCYYSGMTLGVTVPFYFYLGLAISTDGGHTFNKFSESPILDRADFDPFLTGHACVLREGGLWRMWYVSGQRWEIESGGPKHYYHIKYSESGDGLKWVRKGVVCIDFKSADEYAIGRPCVIRDPDIYRMWYSYRGGSYRIGYAESKDGVQWVRKDEEAGIDVSNSGWDSEMIEYAHVFDHRGTRYMLYNGNGYGRTGIGLAVLA